MIKLSFIVVFILCVFYSRYINVVFTPYIFRKFYTQYINVVFTLYIFRKFYTRYINVVFTLYYNSCTYLRYNTLLLSLRASIRGKQLTSPASHINGLLVSIFHMSYYGFDLFRTRIIAFLSSVNKHSVPSKICLQIMILS